MLLQILSSFLGCFAAFVTFASLLYFVSRSRAHTAAQRVARGKALLNDLD